MAAPSPSRFDNFLKIAAFLGSGVATAGLIYAAYKRWWKINTDSKDEGFVDEKVEDNPERKILVLGLDGAGKTRLLRALSKNELDEEPLPTDGFYVVCVPIKGISFNMWEISGAKEKRKYWNNFIQDSNVLMFVVDASNEDRFPEAFNELHRVLADERLGNIPILLVASKQDVRGAKSPSEVLYALGMDSLNPSYHRVTVAATEVTGEGENAGVNELKETLSKLCR